MPFAPLTKSERDGVCALLLVVAVAAAYAPVWSAGFIWDDDKVLTANPAIVGPLGLREIWTTRAADICPLTVTTFWAEYAFWGAMPLPYHLVNVALHAGCALLLWQLLLALRVPGPWLGTALWALHPVQAESVAWVAEMKNTESGLFYISSLIFFTRWLESGRASPAARGRVDLAGTLLFAALAMASKASAVILPAVFVLVAWWREGGWRRRNLAVVGPTLVISAAVAALSVWTQTLNLSNGPDPLWAPTGPERIVNAGAAVWFYLAQLLWPHPLMTIYPGWPISADSWHAWLPLLALAALISALCSMRATWARACRFVLLYFIVALLPVLGFVTTVIFSYSTVFDHFQYLSSMAPLALAGAGLTLLAGKFNTAGRRVLTFAAILLLSTLGTLTWQQGWKYQSRETLWLDTVAKNPQCWLALNNLGKIYMEEGRRAEAIPLFQRTLEICPPYYPAENNLGVALSQEGRVDEAIVHYQRALAMYPRSAPAHTNLAFALMAKGRLNEAIAEFHAALELQPDLPDARNGLIQAQQAAASGGR